MSAAERRLASEKSFLVAVTRIADQATLVVDSGRALERAVLRNPGEKTSAMDVGRAMSEPTTRMSVQDRAARDPSIDLTALRVPMNPSLRTCRFLKRVSAWNCEWRHGLDRFDASELAARIMRP